MSSIFTLQAIVDGYPSGLRAFTTLEAAKAAAEAEVAAYKEDDDQPVWISVDDAEHVDAWISHALEVYAASADNKHTSEAHFIVAEVTIEA